MYGLLLEGVRQFICTRYGEDQWNLILREAEIDNLTFSNHDVYGETFIPNIVSGASKILGLSIEDIMFQNGVFFINYLSQYGYDGILRVLGRDLRDFLNGLDNLHEYLRFSYPKLKPPSFFCVNESKTGITLQYRSRRTGYIHYVRGQITEISRLFYSTDMKIEIVCETFENNLTNCIMRLHFYNKNFHQVEDNLPVPSEVFFEVFPFNMVFNRGMKVMNCGRGLTNALPNLTNSLVTDYFILSRPLIDFTWDGVMLHTNNIFEVIHLDSSGSIQNILKQRTNSGKRKTISRSIPTLKMRGQMKYMPEWDAIVFLGTPIMRDVDSMYQVGLFINDLSMHDSSRDLVLAGEQQSAELKLALEQESEKSKKLEESLKKLDVEMKKTDELLFQMIPKTVAERLRLGTNAVDTCETFDEVTILFSDVVGFTTICSHITPFEVVEMLNMMYSTFDELTEKHKVYKVETIGDAYMIASGCPTITTLHAPFIIEMAMDMVKAISFIKDPSNNLKSLQIRVGVHTGMVVAGVVGLKMPRYCLFGDTVNTASRMESNSEPQKIHISDSTRKKIIEHQAYIITNRGHIEVKGKGEIETFWMEGHDKHNAQATARVTSLLNQLEQERIRLSDSNLASSQIRGDHWESRANSAASATSGTAGGGGGTGRRLRIGSNFGGTLPPLNNPVGDKRRESAGIENGGGGGGSGGSGGGEHIHQNGCK